MLDILDSPYSFIIFIDLVNNLGDIFIESEFILSYLQVNIIIYIIIYKFLNLNRPSSTEHTGMSIWSYLLYDLS